MKGNQMKPKDWTKQENQMSRLSKEYLLGECGVSRP
jgi:hypothetical protein